MGTWVNVSDVERLLLAHLGVAAWLTTAQVARLGMALPRASELLNDLSRPGGRRLVTRLTFQVKGGAEFAAWALTEPGRKLASEILGREVPERPRDRTGSFLLKCTRVNEVYLSLAELEPRDSSGLLAIPTRYGWQTAPRCITFLPVENPLVLRPTASLFIKSQRLRVFIEDEGDGVVPDENRDLRRVRLRLKRYARYFERIFKREIYDERGCISGYEWWSPSLRRFPHAFPVALIFLAPSIPRRKALSKILGRMDGAVCPDSVVWKLRHLPGAVELLRHWATVELPIGPDALYLHIQSRVLFFDEHAPGW